MDRQASTIKILQVIPTLEAGGAEGFVTNLGVGLVESGAHVKFFLMAGVRGERGQVLLSRLQKAGIDVVGVEEHNIRSPLNILRLARLIRTWRPIIVQANMYQPEVLITLTRVLAIGSCSHYVRRLANTEQVGNRSLRITRLMDRCFELTIACSQSVADAYRAFMGDRFKSKLVPISNGGLLQDAVTSVASKRDARERLALPTNAFIIAHIGRMSGGRSDGTGIGTGQKGHDTLLRSFAEAFKHTAETFLLLVGDGPARCEVEALAKELGISAKTRFLGKQAEPWPVLHAADMFCFPSRFEGLPNVLPEAASCGLPVLTTDIPEISSLSPGGAWILKPVDDVSGFAKGMWSVYNNQEECSRKARAVAGSFRERFSMKTCSQKYLKAYENLASA
jgi:glycosyltransferase involved in cell wall biosynthesis